MIVLSQPASAFSETSLLASAVSAIYYSLFPSEPSIQIKLSAMMMKESLWHLSMAKQTICHTLMCVWKTTLLFQSCISNLHQRNISVLIQNKSI